MPQLGTTTDIAIDDFQTSVCEIKDSTTNNRLIVDSSGRITVNTATAIQSISGVGLTATVSGNSLSTVDFGMVRTTNPSGGNNGVTFVKSLDSVGRTPVVVGHIRALISQTTTSLTTASESIVVPAAVGVYNDITFLKITNCGALNTQILLRDAVDGTVRDIFMLSPSATYYNTYTIPIKNSNTNQAWTLSASTADVTNYISVFTQYAQNI